MQPSAIPPRKKPPKPLNNTFVNSVKFSGKTNGDKYADGSGLYLFVTSTGKHWRMDYALHGKRRTHTFGTYPVVSLADARLRKDEAKRLVKAGIDPTRIKQQQARAGQDAAASVFEQVSDAWLKRNTAERGPKTLAKVAAWLAKDINPFIGSIPVKDLTGPDILGVVERVEARGARDSARRILQICRQVLSYAEGKGMVPYNVAAKHFRDNLAPAKSQHYAAITDPSQVASLLRAVDGYSGHIYTRVALKLAPLVFVRPGELRTAEWSEIDFENRVWDIPAKKMKMKRAHSVPLSRQAIELLQSLQNVSGHGRYVFPSIRTDEKPMSDNTLNAALRALGYDRTVMVAHGFRALARTILDEVCKERVDLIEHQLAHTVKDANGTAYNRTTHWPERQLMMQRWADFLETLKQSASRSTQPVIEYGRSQSYAIP